MSLDFIDKTMVSTMEIQEQGNREARDLRKESKIGVGWAGRGCMHAMHAVVARVVHAR
jgi:hypothetical protein